MTSTVPSTWVIALLGAFAVLVSVATFARLITGRRRMLVSLNVLGTAVHEAGHAAVAFVTGGGVYQVQLTSSESGWSSTWHGSRFSAVVTYAAGYAAPPLAGVAVASLLGRGHAPAVLASTVLVMVAILIVTRDLVTFGMVATMGVLAGVAMYWAPAWLVTGIAYAEAWLLLTSEFGGLANIVASRVVGGERTVDDADNLAHLTRIPAPLWIAGWFALIGWAIWHGVGLMWP